MANTAERRGKTRGSFLRRLVGPRAILGLVALVLAILFIVENNKMIRIHFIVFTAHSRVWVGFLVSLVLGALLGQAFFSFRRMHGRRADPKASDDRVESGPASP
jgi:uncharacterized integral membrane protein